MGLPRAGVLALGVFVSLTAAAQEAPRLGAARQVQVKPRSDGRQAVRLTLGSGLPNGSVVDAWLEEEERPPPFSPSESRVRAGELELLLPFPRRAAPGLYEVLIAVDPRRQPRYLPARCQEALSRRVPVVLGSAREALTQRAEARAAAAAGADALVGLAAELVQTFGGARPPGRAAFRAWLLERGAPRQAACEAALAELPRGEATARVVPRLRSRGARLLGALGASIHAHCRAHELPLPAFASEASREAPDPLALEALLRGTRLLRASARRRELAPEPSPATIRRLRRRLAWLGRAEEAPADVTRPEVLAFVLEDLRLGLDRLRRPCLAEPATQRSGERLGAILTRIEALPPERASLAALAPLSAALDEELERLRLAVGRRFLREDRDALVGLRQRLGELSAAGWLTWARERALRAALVRRRAPEAERLAAWLEEAGDRARRGRAPSPAEEQAWQADLAALDQRLTEEGS